MSFLYNHFFQKKKASTLYSDPQNALHDINSKVSTASPNSSKGNISNSTLDSPNYDGLLKTQTSNKYQSPPMKYSKSASVFNMSIPTGNTTVMENIYGIIEMGTNFTEFFSTQNDTSGPSSLSTVSDEEFTDYVEKLKGTYKTYVTEKELGTHDSFEKEVKQDLTGGLMRCLITIPEKYFEDPTRFHFNFTCFDQGPEAVQGMLAELSEYKELVEKNLFSQIVSKSNPILHNIDNMTQQETRIDRMLQTIAAIKEKNRLLKAKSADKVFEVMKNKRRQMNIQRTLQVLEMMNIVKKIAPTIEHLISKGNYDSAVNLIDSSEAILKQKLNSTKALQGFNSTFVQARVTLQQRLGTEFENQALKYLGQTLVYNKKEEGWILDSKAIADDHGKEAERIAKLVQAQIKLKEVSLTGFRPKLHEMLKKFHRQFLNHMETVCNGIAEIKDEKNLTIWEKKELFRERMQLLWVYYQASRAFFERLAHIHNHVLRKTVSYCDNKHKETEKGSQEAIKALTQTVQEFYSVYGVVVRSICDRLTSVMILVDFAGATSEDFALNYNKLFEEIVTYFKGKLEAQEKIASEILGSCTESVKKALSKIIAGFMDQISISSLVNLRLINERQFAQKFFAKRREELLASVRQDKWQTVDVRQEDLKKLRVFYDIAEGIANGILNGNKGNSSTQLSRQNSNSDDEKSSQSSQGSTKSGSGSSMIHNQQGVELDGQVYKITSSYLELINTIYELTLVIRNVNTVREEAGNKTWQLLRAFVATLDWEILKGNAASGVITPEILALAAVSAELLAKGIPIYSGKLEKEGYMACTGQHYESLEAQNEAKRLSKELLAKIGEILRDVVIIDRCSKLKTVNWSTNNKEKGNVVNPASLQLLEKVKAVYKKVSKMLPPNLLKITFSTVLQDLTKYYVNVFEEVAVNNGTVGAIVKVELEGFVKEVKECIAFKGLKGQVSEFEQKVKAVIEHKCEPFIALAAMHEEEAKAKVVEQAEEKKEGSDVGEAEGK